MIPPISRRPRSSSLTPIPGRPAKRSHASSTTHSRYRPSSSKRRRRPSICRSADLAPRVHLLRLAINTAPKDGEFMNAVTTKRVESHEHWTKNASGHNIFMAERRSVTQPPKGTILLVHGSSMGSQAFDLDIPGDPDTSIL